MMPEAARDRWPVHPHCSSLRAAAMVAAVALLAVPVMAAAKEDPRSRAADLLPTKPVLGPLDLSEIPPVLHLDWLRTDQYLLTCRGDPKEYGGNARLLFYCVDVRAKTLSLIGRQRPYHVWTPPQPWRLVDAGEALFVFPALPPEQFGPLAPVYRGNPGGWVVQPYRSVNPGLLARALFAQVVWQEKGVVLRILDGTDAAVTETPVVGLPSQACELRDCALARAGDRVCGLLGAPGVSGGYRDLWHYEVATAGAEQGQVAARLVGRAGSPVGESDLQSPTASPTEWFSPGVAHAPRGLVLAWNRSQAALGTEPAVETFECLASLPANECTLSSHAVRALGPVAPMQLATGASSFRVMMSNTGRTMTSDHPLRTPVLACSPDGSQVAYSIGWNLYVITPDWPESDGTRRGPHLPGKGEGP